MPQKNLGLPPLVESVVHPTDFSPASERAFAHALAIALLRQTSLELLHVDKDKHHGWNEFPHVRATLERWNLLKPGSTQEDVFAELGVRVSKHALSSRFPAVALQRYLDRSPADLLVVATEGREGLARWLHGSVAEAMARWSKTMTLFVPNKAQRSMVSPADGSLTLANVLVPLDRSPDPRAAIEFARRVVEIGGDSGVDHAAARRSRERHAARRGRGRRRLDVQAYVPPGRSGRADPGGRGRGRGRSHRDAHSRPCGRVRRAARQHDRARAAPSAVPVARGARAGSVNRPHHVARISCHSLPVHQRLTAAP